MFREIDFAVLQAWGEAAVRRRELLKAAAAATFSITAAPRLGRGADRAKTLVFVPTSDLTILDPVVTGARPTRNSAYLVFDTLYGIDTEWKAQPQMVEGHTVEEDGLTWTLKLRDGLRFHDKEPVLGRDVVASIRRFAPRVIFANALVDATDELSAPDDRTVRFRLKRPFPHLPEALAGPGGNVPAIMPERLAAESPYKPVAEIVGSGPYRFLKDEHLSGARAVFERFAEYQPRAGGRVGFTSGPKVTHFERVEWVTLDPFSASAALRRGEIDWWENPPRDLVDQVRGDPNITVVSHFAAAIGIMTFNHRYPPFDNPAIRRALLGAIDQAEAISTIAGSDRDNWRDGVGLFGTGTPLATDVGIEVLHSPRDYAAVKRALAEAGYKGEKIVVMAPTDVSELGNLTRTGAEQLRRAGMNVDLQEMDFGSVVRRRGNQGPPDRGGYNMFCTLIDRSLPNVHPYGNLAIRADGKEPINGWANSPRIEELRAAWLDTADLEQQKRICVDLQKQLWEDVPFIPMGEYWQATAYRKHLTDILPGCFATFYGVRTA
jgi:peptide/nickel transport system substrate-binding protein